MSTVFVNGVDFFPEAIKKLYTDENEVILGGHVAEIAWILVMIHDDFYGINTLNDSIPSILFALTKKNAIHYTKLFKKENFKSLDFTRFSKILNPKRKQYNFSFEELINQLTKKADKKKK